MGSSASPEALALYEGLASPVWIFDLDHPQMVWANTAAVVLWGANTREELLARDFDATMSDATRFRLRDYKARLGRGESVKEQWSFYPNARPVVVDIHCVHAGWPDKPSAMRVQVVSFQSKALDHLELRSIEAIRHSNVAIGQFGYSGDLFFQNPISLHLFSDVGLEERVPLDDHVSELFAPLRAGQVFDRDVEVHTADGRRWMKTVAREVVDPVTGTKSILLEQKDVTAQKDAEAELRATSLQLIHSAKLASLGEMAGGVAHEINNPTTAIRFSIDATARALARSAPDFEAKFEKYSGTIVRNCERISRIVNGLRRFSRDDGLAEFELYSVAAVITDSLDLCKNKFASHGVELRVCEVEPDLQVWCKPISISQVLINLLNNAYDAINDVDGPRWIEIGVERTGATVEFSVVDSGPGIKADVVKRIFDPFYTSKPVGAGTGLGLSISRGIVQTHGFDLIYDANHPQTRFAFKLNRAAPPSDPTDERESSPG